MLDWIIFFHHWIKPFLGDNLLRSGNNNYLFFIRSHVVEDLHNFCSNIPKAEAHLKTQKVWNHLRRRDPDVRLVLDTQHLSLLFKSLPNKDDGIFRCPRSSLHDNGDKPDRIHSGDAGERGTGPGQHSRSVPPEDLPPEHVQQWDGTPKLRSGDGRHHGQYS